MSHSHHPRSRPINRQCRDPAPTGDAAGTDKGVSGQRPTAGQFRGHQWAGTVATGGQFRCDTAVFMAADTRCCLHVLATSPERSSPRVRPRGVFPGQSSGGGARYCCPLASSATGRRDCSTAQLLTLHQTRLVMRVSVPAESLGVDGDAEDGPAAASDQTFDSREDSSRSPRPRSTLDGSGLADRNLLTGRVVGDGDGIESSVRSPGPLPRAGLAWACEPTHGGLGSADAGF